MRNFQNSKFSNWHCALIERLCAYSAQMVILFDFDCLTSNTSIFERIVGTGYDVYDYNDNLSLFFYLESKRQMVSGN
ncbi:MAG: hypothetical protein LHW48_09650, partial [Candidatus Cloacimonetes bacterium]|nr:hypothetical protein [Candidatus Cloacimonadota bacterium]